MDESLSHGSVELYVRCPNLTAIGWGDQQPFSACPSLLRIDLSGCPKLESIPMLAFGACHHLVSVVFGEHSNITNLGAAVFDECFALKSITLPNNLKVIESWRSLVAKTGARSLVAPPSNASSATKPSKLSAIAHSKSTPSSKLSSLHPARFPSLVVHSLVVIA